MKFNGCHAANCRAFDPYMPSIAREVLSFAWKRTQQILLEVSLVADGICGVCWGRIIHVTLNLDIPRQHSHLSLVLLVGGVVPVLYRCYHRQLSKKMLLVILNNPFACNIFKNSFLVEVVPAEVLVLGGSNHDLVSLRPPNTTLQPKDFVSYVCSLCKRCPRRLVHHPMNIQHRPRERYDALLVVIDSISSQRDGNLAPDSTCGRPDAQLSVHVDG
mmetsp:Transcript_5323/g.8384  ORF Transcript_5323/g.8384 Transcript_5323/m.8384 type:complete len:216 (+) Transcript_5323:2228-2875(+)